MKISTLLIALVAGLSGFAQAENVATWSLLGKAGGQTFEASSSSATGVAGLNFTRGSGMATSSAGSSFSSSGWESATSGFGSSRYLSFGFSVTNGYTVDPVRGKPCRLGQGQERGRQGRPCAGFSAGFVVAQCTGG